MATVCGPVWKLGSQKKSWFQMVSVSDGLARFGSVRICRTGKAACPDFGTVEFGVVCDGFGRLSFFVLQCWEEIWRGLGGFALFSVVSFAPEVRRRATSAGYAHLYRRTQSGRRFGAKEWHVLLASQGGGFCWVDFSFKFCNKALPLLF